MKRVCATVVMAAIGLVAATARNGDTVERPGTSSIEIARDTLPAERTIIVLEHAR